VTTDFWGQRQTSHHHPVRSVLSQQGSVCMDRCAQRLTLPAWINFIEPGDLGFELLLWFSPIRIRDAAIDGTDCCALGFIVESNALCTLIWHDVKIIGREKANCTAWCRIICAIGLPTQGPISPSFIYSVVRALRLACTTVDAFRRDHDSHNSTPSSFPNKKLVCILGMRALNSVESHFVTPRSI